MRKKQVGFESALLVNVYVIVLCFAGSLLAWWVRSDAVAALLLAVAVVGLVSRLWGEYALRRLRVTVDCGSETLSVGQSVTLHYSAENDKLLPLIWWELGQDVPTRGCMVPENGFTLCEFDKDEANFAGCESAYLQRFAFLMGFSRAEWDCRWRGVRRGVWRPEGVMLRSGDGFGLTQITGSGDAMRGRCFVVWPEIVEVDETLLLKNVWTGHTGRSGWVEDPGVLRSERLYQPGDAWKRIDWRMAARQDEIYVRQYDTVLPQSFLFILDVASLTDAEEAISLTASLILALSRRGIPCGLALPATKAAPMLLLRPDDPSVTAEDCLFALSELDAETAGGFDRAALASAAAEAGQVWLVGERAQELSASELAAALRQNAPRFLCKQPDGALSFARLRREGADA